MAAYLIPRGFTRAEIRGLTVGQLRDAFDRVHRLESRRLTDYSTATALAFHDPKKLFEWLGQFKSAEERAADEKDQVVQSWAALMAEQGVKRGG